MAQRHLFSRVDEEDLEYLSAAHRRWPSRPVPAAAARSPLPTGRATRPLTCGYAKIETTTPLAAFTDNYGKAQYSVMAARDMLTLTEAALTLGVSERRAQQMAESGQITRVARGLFDRASIERHRAERGTGLTRTWAEHTAWGAIAMLSQLAPLGLGDTQTYRLRAALREITDPNELAIRLRDRATVTTWAGHRSVTDRVRKELIVPGRKRIGLVEDDTLVDGYIHSDDVHDLVRRYRLTQDDTGTITMRVTDSVAVDLFKKMPAFTRTLAGVDAATSLDPRERGVGERLLASRLELFRENSRR
jgi:hypothetical protein